MSQRGQALERRVFMGRGRRRTAGLYLSLFDEKQSECAEEHRGRFLGVEGLNFHGLTEHRHGKDQAQDLHKKHEKHIGH